MKIVILLLIAASIFISSCTKNKLNPSHPVPELEISATPVAHKGGDDDDGGPIVMFNINDQSFAPVGGVLINLVKGEDTLTGRTDAYGQAIIKVPGYGDYFMYATHPDYRKITDMITVALHDTILTYTLRK